MTDTVETAEIQLNHGKLWAKFKVVPPPEDEEYLDHELIELRLDSEEGCLVTWLYWELEDLQQMIDDHITTELN